MSTTIPINNTTQLERGTAHPIGSTGFNKTDSHHTNTNTHNTSTFAKDGMHANTGAGDTYGHSDTIVKTGQYPTGIENNTTGVPLRTTAHLPSSVSDRNHQPHGAGLAAAATGAHAAHLPAGNAVPVVGGHQNVITGVNNVPTAGPQMQNTVPNAANRDGLVVNDGLGGPLGGAVILGGQCECLANGGACSHGAGKCVCRGCTSQATTVNPGINIGVSTAQYTAPAGTSGFGGGVADKGTGIAGLVQPNPVVNTTNTHHGLTGNHHTTTGHGLTGSHHTGSNTAAAAGAVAGASAMHHASRNVDGDGRHTLGSGHHTTGSNIIGTNTLGSNTNSQLINPHSSTRNPESVIAGSEYASGNIDPSHIHRGAQPASGVLANDQSMKQPVNRSSAASPGPITDNSNPDVFLSSAVGTGLPGTNTYGTHGSRAI